MKVICLSVLLFVSPFFAGCSSTLSGGCDVLKAFGKTMQGVGEDGQRMIDADKNR